MHTPLSLPLPLSLIFYSMHDNGVEFAHTSAGEWRLANSLARSPVARASGDKDVEEERKEIGVNPTMNTLTGREEMKMKTVD